MTDIWTDSMEGWKLESAKAFDDEETLHRLILENPEFLPLAGSPRLTVLGNEVVLGPGYPDILAIESSGRPVIIEVKLARNPEARRAIVSQIISYAAFLHGFDVEALEQGPLRKHLADAGHRSILGAVQAHDQEGAVDPDSFRNSLQEYLNTGRFRLVFVLDEVPAELEWLVAYLDTVTVQELTIDLITLRTYEINGTRVVLPQRVSPGLRTRSPYVGPGSSKSAVSKGVLSDGPDAFRASIANATKEDRAVFEQLISWAEKLAELPNVRLLTNSYPDTINLLPAVKLANASLAYIANYKNKPSIYAFRSVIDRVAPHSIESIEIAIGTSIGQGTRLPIEPQILDALESAYREASGH